MSKRLSDLEKSVRSIIRCILRQHGLMYHSRQIEIVCFAFQNGRVCGRGPLNIDCRSIDQNGCITVNVAHQHQYILYSGDPQFETQFKNIVQQTYPNAIATSWRRPKNFKWS